MWDYDLINIKEVELKIGNDNCRVMLRLNLLVIESWSFVLGV